MKIWEIESGTKEGFSLYAMFDRDICPAIAYVDNLDGKSKKQIFAIFNLIVETGLPHNEQKFKDISHDIFEIKTRSGVRILCFSGGNTLQRSLILTHGFKKPNKKIFQREKQKAISFRELFFQEQVQIEIIRR